MAELQQVRNEVSELNKKVDNMMNLLSKLVPISQPEPEHKPEQVPELETELKFGRYPSGKIKQQIIFNVKTGLETTPSNGGPSSTYYYEDGTIQAKKWKKEGKNYRDDDLPNCEYYYKNGNICTQSWYNDSGNLHRLGNKPASILYDENGIKKLEMFHINGSYCRTNDWDAIEYKIGNKHYMSSRTRYVNDNKPDMMRREDYNHMGILIRLERFKNTLNTLPTIETWNPAGTSKLTEEWAIKISSNVPKLHRPTKEGPAKIEFYANEPFVEYFYYDGTLKDTKYYDIVI